MNYNPSLLEYRSLLDDICASGKYCDYLDALNRDHFLILRHDIEFSVERAYKMALVEHSKNIRATYFVQLTNNSYNALSSRNKKMITSMHEMGHYIGLHYHRNGETQKSVIEAEIAQQSRMLEQFYGFTIDRFSMHRPIPEAYYTELRVDGMINAYSPDFFTLVAKVDGEAPLRVKYIADSQQRWNYGSPDKETFRQWPRIQLLIHPDFWTDEGCSEYANFDGMVREHTMEFIDTIDGECKNFHQYRSQVEENVQ